MLTIFKKWCDCNYCIPLRCYHNNAKLKSLREKAAFTLYKLLGIPLELVESFRYTGVIVDPCLTFSEHTSSFTNRANKMLDFVKRQSAELSDSRVLYMIHCSIIRIESV